MQEDSRRRYSLIHTAVVLALYGSASIARAQEQNSVPQQDSGPVQEVVVTATLRREDVTDVPYSISAISGDDLKAEGVTDLVTLARAAPSFSLVDLGTRYEDAEIPIIRGINASSVVEGPQILTQSPVGIYIDNSPIEGYFELTDVERIEILRGPQGTLYGAGALGGALRIIPNPPELGVLAGSLTGDVSSVAHGNQPGYGFEGFANLPLGDTLALRLSAKYAYEAGFINAFGLEERTGGAFSPPVLAEPSNPVTSPSVYLPEQKGWNDAKPFTGRASLLWKVGDLSAELAYTGAHVEGNAGPQTNTDFPGGPYPIDPRITFPPGGDYQYFSAEEQPYWRSTSLTSLDASYDAGFATVSSISSYYRTGGETFDDDTYQLFIYAPFSFYYTGSPINPRFISPAKYSDSDRAFSQEVRLVSHSGDDHKIDYAVGLFYQNRTRDSHYDSSAPGTDTYSQAQGCTAPYYLGAPFPNCLVTLGPNSDYYESAARQNFQNKSLYGELTLHATRRAQITLGARYYSEDFLANQSETSYALMTSTSGNPTETTNSGALFKVNPSYQFAQNQNLYATFSQGFRPGGANSFTIVGPLAESPQLLRYQADTANNYEIGVKGRIEGNYTYALAVFDVEWDHPQIAGYTPYTSTAVVYNGEKARSRGVEAESAGPLFVPGLHYSASLSDADARLTENFSLPANDGMGSIAPGIITGSAGERLPGSPMWSAAATISYERALGAEWSMDLTANATYTGSILNSLPTPGIPETPIPAYTIGNLSASLDQSRYRVTLYIDNVADKRAVVSFLQTPNVAVVGGLANYYLINRPREIGLRITLMGSKP